ncbi:restriction endonuclease subunit S [Streptomyces cellulosae]
MTLQSSSLGEVAKFTNGLAFKSTDWGDSGARIIRIQNLTDRTKPFNRTQREVPEGVKVHPGDLLVSWSATLGVFEWTGPDVAVLNQHIFRVKPDPSRVDKQYLRYAISHTLREAERHLHGATMKHVNKGDLLAARFHCPSISEQKRIAAVLDQVNTLRTKRRKAIALLDELAQSIFLDMFGNQATNKGRVVNLDMVLERKLSNGISPSSRGDVEAKVLTLSAVTGDSFNSSAWKVGIFTQDPTPTHAVTTDLFMVCRGNGNKKLVGKGVFADANMVDTVYPDTVLAAPIRPNMITQEYLTYVWATPGVRHQIESAARTTNGTYKVNQKTMGAVTFWLPDLEEQRAFQHKMLAVRQAKRDHESHLAALDDLFTSLQQRAFSGTLWDHEAAA